MALLFTYPLDTIKYRMQIKLGENDPKFNSILETINTIFNEGGLGAFYRGFSFGMLQTSLNPLAFLFNLKMQKGDQISSFGEFISFVIEFI